MIAVRRLGRMPYRAAWVLQERLRGERAAAAVPDTLLLCEHPPVFTIGQRDCREDWLASRDVVRRAGIDVIQVNRGGRITYHGPGQLVGYFICDLPAARLGVRDFVTAIEACLIRTLARFGVAGGRDTAGPGVWVGEEKIAAVGLHVSRGITQHGFALNVAPDLAHYRYIVPCGIRGRGVTSLQALLDNAAPSLDMVASAVGEEAQGVTPPRTSAVSRGREAWRPPRSRPECTPRSPPSPSRP